jgi:hypothetical protein
MRAIAFMDEERYFSPRLRDILETLLLFIGWVLIAGGLGTIVVFMIN